jgi:hypothetical protein
VAEAQKERDDEKIPPRPPFVKVGNGTAGMTEARC